jgi:hypothetical protein
VYFEVGKLVDFEGWNLVDYRGTDDRHGLLKIQILDHSPWCWQRFPHGVSLAVADERVEIEGSFCIEGMVNYTEMHYVQQNRAVTRFKQQEAHLFRYGVLRSGARLYVAWRLGTVLSSWLRRMCFGGDLERDLLDLFACAVLLDVYDIVGRVDDLSNAKPNASWVTESSLAVAEIGRCAANSLDHQSGCDPLAALMRVAQNLQLLLFYLSGVASNWNLQGAKHMLGRVSVPEHMRMFRIFTQMDEFRGQFESWDHAREVIEEVISFIEGLGGTKELMEVVDMKITDEEDARREGRLY